MKSHPLFLCIFLIWLLPFAGCNSRSDVNQIHTRNDSDSSLNEGEIVPFEEYVDSVQVIRGSYVNGKKEGLWTYWYPNGNMKAEGHYRDDLKDGMWVEWYSDETLMWKGEWNMGTRRIQEPSREAHILFMGKRGNERIRQDSVYHLQIRVPNIPADHLFIEAENAVISRETEFDHFTCIPVSGPTMKIIVGYYPDTAFRDFRNLIGEYEYRIK
jgi:hypothetical protein